MSNSNLIASLGSVFQLAFVPKDVDAALHHWTKTIGAGPFFRLPNVNERFATIKYKGVECQPIFSATIGYWNDVEIEFLEQSDNTPSIYNDPKYVRSGLHHVGVMTTDIGRAEKTIQRVGGKIVFDLIGPTGFRCFYADVGGDAGLIELVSATPEIAAMAKRVRDASLGWDGTDALRTL